MCNLGVVYGDPSVFNIPLIGDPLWKTVFSFPEKGFSPLSTPPPFYRPLVHLYIVLLRVEKCLYLCLPWAELKNSVFFQEICSFLHLVKIFQTLFRIRVHWIRIILNPDPTKYPDPQIGIQVTKYQDPWIGIQVALYPDPSCKISGSMD